MARAEPELRPCGIAAGHVVASGHTDPFGNSGPTLRSIGTFMRQLDRLSDGRTRAQSWRLEQKEQTEKRQIQAIPPTPRVAS